TTFWRANRIIVASGSFPPIADIRARGSVPLSGRGENSMRVAVFVTALAFCCVAGVPAQGKASPSKFKLNGITWVFVEEHGAKVRETVDHDGNYVARTFVGKELDHGTAVMKGSKACFTSEVDNSGEVCWT